MQATHLGAPSTQRTVSTRRISVASKALVSIATGDEAESAQHAGGPKPAGSTQPQAVGVRRVYMGPGPGARHGLANGRDWRRRRRSVERGSDTRCGAQQPDAEIAAAKMLK